MAKPLEQMTAAELRERLLELDVDEQKHWEQVAAIRYEKAQLALLLSRSEAKEKK